MLRLAKCIAFFWVAQFCVTTPCWCQEPPDSLSENKIISKIFSTCVKCIAVDSSFPGSYAHFKGFIGNSVATLDINIDRAYIFCDSLRSIEGFTVKNKKGVLGLSYDESIFTGGNKRIIQLFLVQQANRSLYGYAIDDSVRKTVLCRFTEDYQHGEVKLNFSSFNFLSKFKNFPVQTFGNLLFSDSTVSNAAIINKLLADSYDIIGLNGDDDELKKIPFTDIEHFKTPIFYKQYAIEKFKRVYKKMITTEFINNAKESGHTDILLNGVTARVVWNDGDKFVIQIIASYADGDAYPYYNTFLFDYDVHNKKMLSENELGEPGEDDTAFEKRKDALIKKLKANNLFDASEDGDEWFLSNPHVAFITNNGVVLEKKGGNHGIHSFYKFYPKNVIGDFLDK